MSEAIKEEFLKKFRKGHHLLSLHHYPSDGEKVKLDINRDWLPYISEEVHLLIVDMYLERQLVFQHVEKLIEKWKGVKEEGSLDDSLAGVMETILLALDYLTHHQLLNTPFTKEHQEGFKDILSECFSTSKTHTFTSTSQRSNLLTSTIKQDEKTIYCLDNRDEKVRIYMGVFFSKSNSEREHFRKVAQCLGDVKFIPNKKHVPYKKAIEGMTDHEMHEDLLFRINQVKRTLVWLVNSISWGEGKLYPFDRMDVMCKLGLQ